MDLDLNIAILMHKKRQTIKLSAVFGSQKDSFHLLSETFIGLKCRNTVFRNNHRRILGDIPGRLLCPLFDNERPKAAQEHFVSGDHAIFDTFHKSLDDGQYGRFLNAGRLYDLGYNVCLCHL